ncbi:hypothetical protein BEWA_021760 [Theileria equi strain WA]|uniref:Brix domain-containing protein n=1 Tax=Theileria equi strain WA TaxID=1537102 RepID=L0AVR1_THEEQ|nr:hypothetical protein BEWA_021760 [Theileria equi strain WA]AFZ79328.1 hypothetical protein BEWA_021760 [Theileria equi strain WA]|eukprot:XP_004828994.1 hypothetical protein BEWA_021760 [Theileria equi strain WA]
MAKASRKARSKPKVDQETDSDEPRILVIRRGIVSNEVKQLAHNLRLVLSPNCAVNLKEGSKQKLRDFTTVADVLSLTHLMVLTQSENGLYLKLAALPKGPTITFSIEDFSLMSDISKQVKNPQSFGTSMFSPLLVLNGFSKTNKNLKVKSTSDASNFDLSSEIASALNSIFSPIDLYTIKIQNCRRAVLFHKDKDSDTIVLRHYSINLVDCHTASAVQDLMNRKSMKHILSDDKDFQDIMNDGLLPNLNDEDLYFRLDSETDEIIEFNNSSPLDIIHRHKYGINYSENSESGTLKAKIAIRLSEIGPRLNLLPIKVQDGVFCGQVKYHRFITKTPEELELNKKLEPEIIKKRKLESDKIEKIFQKYQKSINDSSKDTKKNTHDEQLSSENE